METRDWFRFHMTILTLHFVVVRLLVLNWICAVPLEESLRVTEWLGLGRVRVGREIG